MFLFATGCTNNLVSRTERDAFLSSAVLGAVVSILELIFACVFLVERVALPVRTPIGFVFVRVDVDLSPYPLLSQSRPALQSEEGFPSVFWFSEVW